MRKFIGGRKSLLVVLQAGCSQLVLCSSMGGGYQADGSQVLFTATLGGSKMIAVASKWAAAITQLFRPSSWGPLDQIMAKEIHMKKYVKPSFKELGLLRLVTKYTYRWPF
jgi:hypothetical protein